MICQFLKVQLLSSFKIHSSGCYFINYILKASISLCKLELCFRCCRHTYQSDLDDRYYPTIIPSKSITSSIHRLDERPNLRIRNPKGKLFLCSMCKTHCFDTDNSDREGSATNLTTPPIKISFNAPSGPSIMEIEPKAYKKAHKRKHKNKKQKKSIKDQRSFCSDPFFKVSGNSVSAHSKI